MKSPFRVALLLFVLSILFLLYFATRVSAVYDPIKSYQFALTKDELLGRLTETMNSIPGSTFKLTDSTGTKEDCCYYYDVVILKNKSEYKYNIKYESENSFWDKSVKSQLDLIGAFDDRLRTGGYKIEDTDVKRLMDIFEKEVINKLNSTNTNR